MSQQNLEEAEQQSYQASAKDSKPYTPIFSGEDGTSDTAPSADLAKPPATSPPQPSALPWRMAFKMLFCVVHS